MLSLNGIHSAKACLPAIHGQTSPIFVLIYCHKNRLSFLSTGENKNRANGLALTLKLIEGYEKYLICRSVFRFLLLGFRTNPEKIISSKALWLQSRISKITEKTIF